MGVGRVLLVVGALVCVGCAGEPRVLEPRTPPSRDVPPVQLPASPPPQGTGRVILDATDGPMRVTAQADTSFVPPGASAAPSRTGELCVTPCTADLPEGRYRLFLSSVDGEHGDADDLVVSSGLTVYRRAPGKYVSPSVANRVLPAIVLGLGAVLATLGFVLAASASGSNDNAAPGLVLGGVGTAALIGGGFWAYDASRAVEQRGATTTWQP